MIACICNSFLYNFLQRRALKPVKFTPAGLPGLILIEPHIWQDGRGYFFESYRYDRFLENGIADRFVQDNESKSSAGVLRGLHYQIEPRRQAKLVRILKGKVFDVVVDIRPGSKTFGKYFSMILDGEKKQMLYVPPGFAHGFCTLEDGTEFFYKVSDFYSPECERGILWNDPDLAIDWPKMNYTFSPKDQKYPRFREVFKKGL